MHKSYVGEGGVVLLAGGGKVYTDLAARFVSSERSLAEIVASPYSKEIVTRIMESGHKAALEFDYFLFGIEGYSRVCEAQLVRKRMASYMIKSGRTDKGGKRSYDVVIPRSVEGFKAEKEVNIANLHLEDGTPLQELLPAGTKLRYTYDSSELLDLLESWYDHGVINNVPEEELRYLKPQATEFKAIVGMNAHALNDWFMIRCCRRAQTEIRLLAYRMLRLCRGAAPDLFRDAGPACRVLGYCPENDMQHPLCQGKILTQKQAFELMADSVAHAKAAAEE